MGVSQSRGDNFEIYINECLNRLKWHSRRTGGVSVHFPDILATNNITKTLLTIEAKATSYDLYHIDVDQVLRCFRILEMFSVYEHKYVILAFKFMTKRRLIERTRRGILETDDSVTVYSKTSKRPIEVRRYYENRNIRFYYFIANELFDTLLHPTISYSRILCDYYGNLLLVPKDSVHKKIKLNLPRITLNRDAIIFPDQWQKKNHQQKSIQHQVIRPLEF